MEGLWSSFTCVRSALFREGWCLYHSPVLLPHVRPMYSISPSLCPLPPHPYAAISLPTTHEPSGPGHRVQLSAPSAVAECRCRTFDSTEYTRGCPGRACWWDRGTRPLAFWGLTGTFKGNAYLSLRERQTGGRGRKGEGGVYLSCTSTLALRRCHGRAWGKKQVCLKKCHLLHLTLGLYKQ